MESRQAVISHGRCLEAKLNGKPAQKHMCFAIERQRAQRSVAHQAEIGVVRDDVGTEPIEDAVVEVRGAALEAAVCAATLAHGEDNLGAVGEAVDHLCNDRHIVLQVGVERDHRIGFADLADQARQQCILMSDIARQFEATDAFRLRLRDLLDEVPRSVGAAVVDQQNITFRRDRLCLFQLADVSEQIRQRVLDARLFVVTRDHERNDGRLGCRHAHRCRISALRKCALAAFTKLLRYAAADHENPPQCVKCRPVRA